MSRLPPTTTEEKLSNHFFPTNPLQKKNSAMRNPSNWTPPEKRHLANSYYRTGRNWITSECVSRRTVGEVNEEEKLKMFTRDEWSRVFYAPFP
jgi:hypothetical protein